jgi:hypothetical protein
MSVRVMTLVWDAPRLTDQGETLVMLAFADWANDDGVCWPSMRRLAQKVRYADRRNVRRVVQSLLARGALHLDEGAGSCGQHVYTVSLDWLRAPAEGVRGAEAPPGVTATPPGPEPPGGGVPATPEPPSIPSAHAHTPAREGGEGGAELQPPSRLARLVGVDAPGLARVTPAMPLPIAVWTAVAGQPPLAAMWTQVAAWVGTHPLALEALRDVLLVAVAGGWRLTNVLNVRDAFRREYDERRGAGTPPRPSRTDRAPRDGRGPRTPRTEPRPASTLAVDPVRYTRELEAAARRGRNPDALRAAEHFLNRPGPPEPGAPDPRPPDTP